MPCSSRSWRAVTVSFGDQPVGDHRPQRRAQVDPVAVGDLAGRHGQADHAVASAVVLLRLPRRKLGRRVDLQPDPPANFRPYPLDPSGLDQILQTCAVAVLAVAEVALCRHDRLDHVDDVFGLDPAERLRQERIRVLLAGVAHAEPAAHVDVEPGHRSGQPTVERRHDADVVGQHVDVVVARPGNGDLELARQVHVAVDRLGRPLAATRPAELQWRRLRRDRLLAVDPQLPVRRCLRAKAGDERLHERTDDRLTLVGPWRAHHVAHDVAARRQRRQQGAVDPGDELAQLTLVHDVELHALARGEAHRAVGEVGHTIERQPLLAGQRAAGHRGPDHAGVVERELLRRSGATDVTVVLLVDPVELEQHGAVVGEAVAAVDEVLGQLAAAGTRWTA